MTIEGNNNIERIKNRANNVRILSGRLDGQYIEQGYPRGGTCSTKKVVRTFYEAVQLSADDVLRNRGLIDNPNGIFVSAIAVGEKVITFKLDNYGRCFDRQEEVVHGEIAKFNKK